MFQSKFSIIILFILLSFSINSFAQTDSTQINLDGKWALQFQITDNFTLSSFQGATISGKYHLSNSKAIRLGVSIRANNIESTDDLSSYVEDTLSTLVSVNDELSNIYINFSLQYLYYMKMNGSISMYFGSGLFYGTTINNREYKALQNHSYAHTNGRENSTHSVGISFLIGTEWFVSSNIGIMAEYGSSFSYRKSTSSFDESLADGEGNTHPVHARKTEETEYKFQYNNVKFGVSIYF